MQPAAFREALLEQLAYLIDEIEALKPVARRVPEPLQAARPLPTDFSMKEIYGLLAMLDETVHLPRFRRLAEEDTPAFEPVDEAALVGAQAFGEVPLSDLLSRVQQARRRLVDFLRALPPEVWARPATLGGTPYDGYALAHRITQQDADRLRPLAYRLYGVERANVKR